MSSCDPERRLALSGGAAGVMLLLAGPALARQGQGPGQHQDQGQARSGLRGERRVQTRPRGGQDRASSARPLRTLTHGPDPLQAVDLYAGDETGPILMFVHGGGWSLGERSRVNALPDYALRHGLTLASASYRLAPAVTAREAAFDVAAGVAAVARALPGRPIFLLGHSAGAHLAALIGIDPVYLGAVGHRPSDLAGVLLLDGAGYNATDRSGAPRGPVGRGLERMYDQAFGPQGDPLRAALSPTLRVGPGLDYPPYLIFHVAHRQDATAQSQALGQALRSAGGQAEVISVADESHRTINTDFGLAGELAGERSAQFIAETTPRRSR